MVIYHGGEENREEILEAAFKRFNIQIDEEVKLDFVRLRYRYLFDSSTWKYATIIG